MTSGTVTTKPAIKLRRSQCIGMLHVPPCITPSRRNQPDQDARGQAEPIEGEDVERVSSHVPYEIFYGQVPNHGCRRQSRGKKPQRVGREPLTSECDPLPRGRGQDGRHAKEEGEPCRRVPSESDPHRDRDDGAPDRETPGMRAVACTTPRPSASTIVSASSRRDCEPTRSAVRRTTAPTASATAATPGVRIVLSMTSPSAKPTSRMGTVPIVIRRNRRAGALGCAVNMNGRLVTMLASSRRKYTTTASSVPTWQATSNARPNWSDSHPKTSRARRRCAELETGRNSVSPWMTPRSAAWRTVTRGCDRSGRLRLAARSLRPRRGSDPGRCRLDTAQGAPLVQEDGDHRRNENGRVGARDDTDQHRERKSA